MTFTGQVDAGSTCSLLHFEGTVKGLPGVARFWGKGNLFTHENLYDASGNLVGFDQPLLTTPESDDPAYTNCEKPEGVTWNHFSATVELFGPNKTRASRRLTPSQALPLEALG